MIKPRVFVSSVIEGYEHVRSTARAAIESSGCVPVMAEDFPSRPTSSRNACLDQVETCDALVIIVGVRGGHVADSGKLVVEEEIEAARENGIEVLVFLEDVEARDAHALRLSVQLSDYVSGYYRQTFRDTHELSAKLQAALVDCRALWELPLNSDSGFRHLFETHPSTGSPTLRLFIAPQRANSLLQPGAIDESEVVRAVRALARSAGAFDDSKALPSSTESDRLVIRQMDEYGRRPKVELRLSEGGVFVLDSECSPPRSSTTDLSHIFEVHESRLEELLMSGAQFGIHLYQDFDKYERHTEFLLGVALFGLESRRVVADIRPRDSYQPRMETVPNPVLGTTGLVRIHRRELASPSRWVKEVVVRLRRAAS